MLLMRQTLDQHQLGCLHLPGCADEAAGAAAGAAWPFCCSSWHSLLLLLLLLQELELELPPHADHAAAR
jgi:hypothetical protein